MRRLLHRRLFAMMMMSTSLSVLAQVSDPSSVAGPVTVSVQSFAIAGNTLLSDDHLAAIVRPFLGTRTLDELKEAALAVQTAYRDAGYGAVAAFLPQQSPPDGRFEIRVVEGHLSKIRVEGAKQFSEANVLASLPALRPGVTPQVREIDRQIRLANENPAEEGRRAAAAWSQAGRYRGHRHADRDARQSLDARPRQYRQREHRPLAAGLGCQHATLWDQDHVLSTAVQTSPDKPSSDVGLERRLPRAAVRAARVIDAYAAYSDIDGNTATVAGDLQIQRPRPPRRDCGPHASCRASANSTSASPPRSTTAPT